MNENRERIVGAQSAAVPRTSSGNFDLTAFRLRGSASRDDTDIASKTPGHLPNPPPHRETPYSFKNAQNQQSEWQIPQMTRAVAGLEHLVAPPSTDRVGDPTSTPLRLTPSMGVGGIGSGGSSLPPGYGAFSQASSRGLVPPVVGAFGTHFDTKALQAQRIEEQKIRQRHAGLSGLLTDQDFSVLGKFLAELSKSGYSDQMQDSLVQRAVDPILKVRRGEAKNLHQHAEVRTINYSSVLDEVQLAFCS